MIEILLSQLLVHTSGEYFQSELLTVTIINEQHTVGAFRHYRSEYLDSFRDFKDKHTH
jgi:hypothetical protein